MAPDLEGPAELGGAQRMAAYGECDLRELLDWAMTQAPVNIALIDTQLRQLRLNDSLCRVQGLTGEAAGLGLRLTDVMAGPETEPLVAAARTVVDTGEPQIWRGINRVLGESYDIPAEVSLSPVKDSAGLVRACWPWPLT